MDFTHATVHPLYLHLQDKAIADADVKLKIRQRRKSIESGELDFIRGEMDTVDATNMTKKIFYHYLSHNQPVKVAGGCSHWPAIEKWKDEKYLITQTKATQATNFAWEAMGSNIQSEDELNEYLKQLNRTKTFGTLDFAQGMVHLQNLWINRNQQLEEDYEAPEFFTSFLELEDIYLSYFSEDRNEELKGLATQ